MVCTSAANSRSCPEPPPLSATSQVPGSSHQVSPPTPLGLDPTNPSTHGTPAGPAVRIGVGEAAGGPVGIVVPAPPPPGANPDPGTTLPSCPAVPGGGGAGRPVANAWGSAALAPVSLGKPASSDLGLSCPRLPRRAGEGGRGGLGFGVAGRARARGQPGRVSRRLERAGEQ